MNSQTSPDSEENNTHLFSKPAYLRKTSSALEIHIPDCFWYPQISFDWEILTAKEFHYLIDKIRTGLLYIARQNFPAEENSDSGFSSFMNEYLQKTPGGRIGIILLPVHPHPVRTNPAYDTSGRDLMSAEDSVPKKKTIIRQDKVKRWMEFKELRDKISLACELKRTGGYIVRMADYLRCTRQQIHTAMKCHGFLRGEVMIFRGGCCC